VVLASELRPVWGRALPPYEASRACPRLLVWINAASKGQAPAIPICSLGRLELMASWLTRAYKSTITPALPTDDDVVSQSQVTIRTSIKEIVWA
jgi:hypothetical protein